MTTENHFLFPDFDEPALADAIQADAIQRNGSAASAPLRETLSEPHAEAQRSQSWTVAQVIDRYLADLRLRRQAGQLGEATFDNAARDLRRFKLAFGSQQLAQCRKHDLTNWLAANPQWKAPDTIKRAIGTVLQAFRWAVDEELIPASPYRTPKAVARLKRRRRRDATVAEYVTLMRHGKGPARTTLALRRALFFLCRSGCRPAEMRGLTVDMIDFKSCCVVSQEHKTRHQQRDPQPRIFGLDIALLRFLRNVIRRLPPGDTAAGAATAGRRHVFLNSEGQPWGDRHVLARHFRRVADRLGLASDLSIYCFRHTWTTMSVEAGLSDQQIADQLGHTTTRLVGHYSHAARKRAYLRRVAEASRRRRRKGGGEDAVE